jgi:hypothetical protein
MTRRFLGVTFFALALAAPGVVAQTASGDGLPITGVEAGPTGVANPGEEARYVALSAAGGTVVARVERDGGRVLRSAFLRGRFTVPAVALDGSAGGLSKDGKTLVLIRPRARFPRAKTTLAILDAERLRPRDVVTLRGDFSFDAITPGGALLYLVEYVSRRDPTRYVVRAYDARANRLLPEPVVDKREPGERMRGYPITRATSPDGHWAYTLYDGAGKHPFIHALDTLGRRAVCIDLNGLTRRDDLYSLHLGLSANGRRLAVADGETPVATVDTRSFRVEEPAATSLSGTTDDGPGGGVWGPPAWLAGVGLVLLACLLSLVLRRRRKLAPVSVPQRECLRPRHEGIPMEEDREPDQPPTQEPVQPAAVGEAGSGAIATRRRLTWPPRPPLRPRRAPSPPPSPESRGRRSAASSSRAPRRGRDR